MELFDFSQTKIRCSSLGLLMTEPKAKGEILSETAKGMLREVYGIEKYSRKKDVTTKYMEKGTLVEEDSITLLSRLDKVVYLKNEERISNDWVSGTPDIYLGESILKTKVVNDIKSSWDLKTFLANIGKPLDKGYYWQLQGYFFLTGASEGSICYTLTDTPPHIIQKELYSLLYKMNAATEDSPEYKEAAAELEYNMLFGDIPFEERILKFKVERNDEDIDRIKDKVIAARQWLQWFQLQHLNFNK